MEQLRAKVDETASAPNRRNRRGWLAATMLTPYESTPERLFPSKKSGLIRLIPTTFHPAGHPFLEKLGLINMGSTLGLTKPTGTQALVSRFFFFFSRGSCP